MAMENISMLKTNGWVAYKMLVYSQAAKYKKASRQVT